jgi:uncharacterized ion transporter superfamily protein YfcC
MLKKTPDTLVIISFILFLAIILTWIVPAGEYLRQEINGRSMVQANSFRYIAANPQSLWALFTTPIRGFTAAAEIIGFVLLVGGAFGILNGSGAVDAGLQRLVRWSYERPQYKKWIVPMLMLLFSLAGGTFGMSEESLVFILICIPLAHKLGYDTLVGVAIPFVGSGIGFAGAIFNPFTVGIAQGIAELPPFSGWEYRLFIWLIFTLVSIAYVMWYAGRVQANPQNSLLYGYETHNEAVNTNEPISKFTTAHKIILWLFVLSLILLIYGVNKWDWYITEIAALFLALGVAVAIVGRMTTEVMVEKFQSGAKDMLSAALIIAFSRSILITLQDGKVIDTLLHSVALGMNGLPTYASVQIMLVVQGFINFFVPSGSGQAALTMPIMSPLADLLGISRQVAVLAYQLGSGFFDLIIPTSGVTMGVLAIAKIPYFVWINWIWRLMLILFLLSMVFLAISVSIYSV